MANNGLLSIHEFSKLAEIKASSLRYYDELGLFAPCERSASNYRYYSPQQVTAIKAINLLQDMGVSVRDIARISQNRSPETVLHIIGQHTDDLQAQADEIRRKLGVLHTYEDLIHTAMAADEALIEVRRLEEHPLALGSKTAHPPSSDRFYPEFVDFCAEASSLGIDLSYPVGGLFDSLEDFLQDPDRPNCFFSYCPDGEQARPAGDYLVAYHRGHYGQAQSLPSRIRAYIDTHHIEVTGPVYNVFVLDEITMIERDDYLLQFSVRVI
ncbi:MAG: MerR family transcriptional regulator [Coriobacteriales bacterium]|nr:MerR family transcriptional regulator [Coriobacteriales bacterium]